MYPNINTNRLYRIMRIVFRMAIFILILSHYSCKKLVAVDAPKTSITSTNVYTNDVTAAAVLTGLYTQISASTNTGILSVSLFAGMSADELALFSGYTNTAYIGYYKNALTSSNTGNLDFWNNFYPKIFIANAAIDGLSSSSGLTPTIKQQLIGEAKFIRAFCYFYLVNLYGDVPLVIGTAYTSNAALSRSPASEVWQQIINDLKDAQSVLSDNYLDATLLIKTTERVRPTKWAATALLARSYLYTKKWVDAEAQATAVISNSSLYKLTSLDSVFLKNSTEAIWQIQPVTSNPSNTWEAKLFILPANGPNSSTFPVSLNMDLFNSFGTTDKRRTSWINVTTGTKKYYYPYKYKISALNVPLSEYEMVLRLGEQFLIRSEARAQQGNLLTALDDLNAIHSRAGLPALSISTQTDLLNAILRERQWELFVEWGHRWMDLKRTGSIDSVMNTATSVKGGTWSSNWQFYPIPASEIQRDPSLTQNNGY